MSAFTEFNGRLDWRRIDVQAIVGHHGLAVMDIARRSACLEWLRQQGYRVEQLDCTVGIGAVIERLGLTFHWEEQFGYRLGGGSRNLDALRDGFGFDVPASGGVVFELFRPDLIWHEDARWLLGLLAIASEHSRAHLACGRRFFTLLVLPDRSSPLIGQKLDDVSVPCAHWEPCDEPHKLIKPDA
jgi:hypothetical protein